MTGRIRVDRRLSRDIALFCAAFVVLIFASWPIVWSFDLWALKDRGNLLNLDYLLDGHLRLGIDAYYCYGLLPVLLQRVVFAAFGRGAAPVYALSVAYFVGVAIFCALVLRRLPQRPGWTIALLALAPIMYWINPNLPYCLVVLSMLYGLLALLAGRLDMALAIAIVGIVSVPSLPLAFAGTLAIFIVLDWYARGERRPWRLLRAFAPAAITLVAMEVLLATVFGWRSAFATLLPLGGMEHYRAEHWGNALAFLHPQHRRLTYYVSDRPLWWSIGTAILLVAAVRSVLAMCAARRVVPFDAAIVTVAVVHALFATVGFGPPTQHVIYDPLLVVGALLGIARSTPGRLRTTALVVFVACGVVAHVAQVRATVAAWKHTAAGPETAGLWADRAWTREWHGVRARYAGQVPLVLSYGTGLHQYFPDVRSPRVWVLDLAQVAAGDRQRLLAQIDASTVLIEDLTSPPDFIDTDPDVQHRLDARCLVEITPNVQIWVRRTAGRTAPSCRANPRRFYDAVTQRDSRLATKEPS